VAIRPATREVVVGGLAELAGWTVSLDELNWLAEPLQQGDSCQVQIRYRARAVPARVESVAPGQISLTLLEPVRAVTPGQSGVLYGEGEQVLGGGVIA
jgi:tRNA-specific 2-thiouridylase